MSKVDWSKAPDGAEFYAAGYFYKKEDGFFKFYYSGDGSWECSAFQHFRDFTNDKEYEPRPLQWPESESRMDAIGQNGNDGLVYQQENKVHYDEFREKCETSPSVYSKTPIDKMREAVEAREKECEQAALAAVVGKGKSKYSRQVIGLDGTKTTIDVYRVLDAFKTESAALDHAVKKILCAGNRHSKDRKQDLQEAIDSIAAELLLMSQR